MTCTVAIIGRPNVGKSSLFNRLLRKRLAIVHDKPGITRDSKEFVGKIYDKSINFIDTAGYEDGKNELSKKMLSQAKLSIERADLVLFVVDGKNGLNDDDFQYASLTRKFGKTVKLLVNKTESKTNIDINQLYKLGFGDPIHISSAHGQGIDEVKDFLYSVAEMHNDESASLKFCLVGRPNVGKSTLFNAILGYERSITSSISGTTRDAIAHSFEYNDRVIEIVDTAGLRRKSNISDKIEELSTVETINAIRRSDVTLLVVSSDYPLEKQDLSIARISINEGKPIILIINKSDLIENPEEYEKELMFLVSENLSELKNITVLYTVGIDSKGIDEILEHVLLAEKKWKTHIPTSLLNKWLDAAVSHNIPPIAKGGRRIRIKYCSQTRSKPPTFNFYCNTPEELPDSYKRYLQNNLIASFDLGGVPIRINYIKTKNPYASNKKR